ncbi:endonuclease/exonuclease/phosphatase family protein [Confluentibacter sediminis]|uniref:endonuclease/exonuclease/phosphatase family protein n=1 Tax=Confluentibacter sediminis TaxID=2219045 RepID=UPI000DABBF9A|nr:endonuclease/exonuclease/phosphatase family protein [Confluentibacter sediminis]
MKNTMCFILAFISLSLTMNGQTYKFITYNIRYDNSADGENQWSKRKDYLCDQIAFYSPDVFGIQEGLHHQVAYIDSTFVDYKYVGVGRDDGKTKGEYSAIFYNSKKLKPIKQATFWLSETPNKISVGWDASMERICTYALFENIVTHQQFWVFNTHFDHIGDEARLQSAKLILNKINKFNKKNLPIVLMGDFNLKPESTPIQYLSQALNDSKTISSAKPFGPSGTYNGFKYNKPVTDRIDYIFTSKENIKVQKFAVLSDSKDCKYPSDHLPVFAEIEIK